YRELKGFTEKFIELVEEPYSKFIDVGLLKSCFSLQLFGLTKKECIKRPVISFVKNRFQKLEDYLKAEKEFINFKAQSVCSTEGFVSKECPICKVKYEQDQLYRFIQQNGHFILKSYCKKQYKPEHKSLSFNK
ncbi:14762_t:CDS:2, partial [Cetraspora pellucida]